MSLDRIIDAVDAVITGRPGTTVLVFLVLTGVFVAGLGSIESESGSSQFVEDLDSWDALQDIRRDFGSSFGESTDSTQLLQRDRNVLSKSGLVDMLRAQKRLSEYDDLRVQETSSPASTVARELDPEATTLAAQVDAVEAATPSEIDAAVRRAAEQPGVTDQLHEDFNRESASASAALASVTHDGNVENREDRVEYVLATVNAPVEKVGSNPGLIFPSLALVLPAAFVLIVVFLVVAYRDAVDLVLGVVSILMTLVWTFGFIGLVGIPFSILLVSVPPILIAVGIDFGIHAVNRYREEREQDRPIDKSMARTTDQLLVAFFIVAGTTVIGFLSNRVSALGPIQDFGLVAAIGIVFTFLIFGVFLPAAKVLTDRLREEYPIPTISQRPLGSEASALGRVLSGGTVVAQRLPVAFMLLVLVASSAAGVYATGVGTGFSQEDSHPVEYESVPDWKKDLPDAFAPPEYSFVSKYNYREDHFDRSDRVMMYVEGRMTDDAALERIHRAGDDPPDSFVRDGRRARSDSVVTRIRAAQQEDQQLRALVGRNDRDGDGIPDDNLEAVYDHVESTPGTSLEGAVSDDYRSALVTYDVDPDATNREVAADAREVADRTSLDAQPTGTAVVYAEASAVILDTVVTSLAITLGGSALFLVLVYWRLEGRPSLGLVNLVPIVLTVTFVVASMRYFGIKFNAINGVILSLTVGLGIDYSVHVVHRFADEFETEGVDLELALDRAVRATGGALTGSMLTTTAGVGVLALAYNPTVGVFGALTALSVGFAYLSSVFVLPSVLVVWDRVFNRSAVADWTGASDRPSAPPALPADDD